MPPEKTPSAPTARPISLADLQRFADANAILSLVKQQA